LQILIGQMFRFGLVGILNAAVDAAVFFSTIAALKYFASAFHSDWQLIIANSASFMVAVSCSYILNSRFTFRKNQSELNLRDYFLFTASQITGFFAHTATLVMAAKYVPLPLAKLLGIGIGFVVNFTLARVIVFRKI